MLYLFNELESLENNFSDAMLPFLSTERRAKVERLQSQTGKNASVAAYILLRLALQEEYRIHEAVVFEYLDKGKPVLKDHPHIHFNLSHTKGVAACVISDNKVGVDVQDIRYVTDKAAKRILTENEYIKFKSTPNPDEYFCEIWAIKESYMKMTGQGIAAAFNKMPVNEIDINLLFKENGYYCCVCGSFTHTVQVKHIRREDFEKLHS